MMKKMVVIPCYNESQRFNLDAFVTFLQEKTELKLLFVNDGSTDQTLSLLQTVTEKFPNDAMLMSLEKNSGKAEAVRQGLLQAIEQGADIVGYADADLATPLNEVLRLANLIEEKHVKVLLGSRVKLLGKTIERRVIRHYLGRVFATFTSMLLGLSVYDTQCGAKFFYCSAALKNVLQKPFMSHWAFDVELIQRLMKHEKFVAADFFEEPLNVWIDQPGSKVSFYGMIQAIWDLIRLSGL